jgi:hypothetical protein
MTSIFRDTRGTLPAHIEQLQPQDTVSALKDANSCTIQLRNNKKARKPGTGLGLHFFLVSDLPGFLITSSAGNRIF